jgi:hypothetical protein
VFLLVVLTDKIKSNNPNQQFSEAHVTNLNLNNFKSIEAM